MIYAATALLGFMVLVLAFVVLVTVRLFKRNKNINKTSRALDAEYEELLADIKSGSRRTRNAFKLH